MHRDVFVVLCVIGHLHPRDTAIRCFVNPTARRCDNLVGVSRVHSQVSHDIATDRSVRKLPGQSAIGGFHYTHAGAVRSVSVTSPNVNDGRVGRGKCDGTDAQCGKVIRVRLPIGSAVIRTPQATRRCSCKNHVRVLRVESQGVHAAYSTDVVTGCNVIQGGTTNLPIAF